MKLKHGKKSGLKKFTIKDIRSWNPCYDPSSYLKETFKGSAIDILNNENIPFADRLWVVLRTEILSDKMMRLFAVWSYRQTLVFIKNPDPRSIHAANTAEAFALGNATTSQLVSARSAAHLASDSASDSAAHSAHSASDSADDSARSAAYSAAHSAHSVAYLAADSAFTAAAYSSANSARSEARSAQKQKLIEMILIEAKDRIKK